jgi:hypothetical protein
MANVIELDSNEQKQNCILNNIFAEEDTRREFF